jgi:hypothetical protein
MNNDDPFDVIETEKTLGGVVSPNRRKFRRVFSKSYSPIIPTPIWLQSHQGQCSAH